MSGRSRRRGLRWEPDADLDYIMALGKNHDSDFGTEDISALAADGQPLCWTFARFNTEIVEGQSPGVPPFNKLRKNGARFLLLGMIINITNYPITY